MEPRKLTKADIDKVREIEGFPKGEDEDIIELSNAPYYTACPNPFIEEFIDKYGEVYNEEEDIYDVTPFVWDVSEGKNDPVYNAHSYHTKVPYKAIMRYILHYTKPGDIVLDGFSGTGMTGVAARVCEHPGMELKTQIEEELGNVEWGERKAILCDLSPMASFITHNYNKPLNNVLEVTNNIEDILQLVQNRCQWMYETDHVINGEIQYGIDNIPIKGIVNNVIWSDVFICPTCGEELVYWDIAVNESGKVKDRFNCTKCNAELAKNSLIKSKEMVFDNVLKKSIERIKQRPVSIQYSVGTKRFKKQVDQVDLDILEKIEDIEIKGFVPKDRMPEGNEARRNDGSGVQNIHQFYFKRTLNTLSQIYDILKPYKSNTLKYIFTSILINTTKMYKYRDNGKGSTVSGTYYIPTLKVEINPINAFRDKAKVILRALGSISQKEYSVINSNQSLTDLSNIPEKSIDYIFTDPPFGHNLMYSELNYIWEGWLKVFTNNGKEAVVTKWQNKTIFDYQELMEKCFEQYYKVLKPGRWMTVEFHNSQNSVWNAIQNAILRAGFVVGNVSVLDKGQGSFKQVTSATAVKQDLVISAYKPKESFKKRFIQEAGTVEGVWDFIEEHLRKLPIVVNTKDGIGIVAERQKYLLFDAMLAYHIQQGIYIPLDAGEFYAGLENRYMKRDDMYFLIDQVYGYEQARQQNDLIIQLSYVITNEKDAIGFLTQELVHPQTYQEIQPKFVKVLKQLKYEDMPELLDLLEENFLKNEQMKYYIPDITKQGDIEKLREKKLLKQFDSYLEGKGKFKTARIEAIQAGFKKAWKEKDFETIVKVGNRLPDSIILEDQKLFMYYDNAKLQVEE